eukprot:13608069-Heterocapsa_arctica.AAC.1
MCSNFGRLGLLLGLATAVDLMMIVERWSEDDLISQIQIVATGIMTGISLLSFLLSQAERCRQLVSFSGMEALVIAVMLLLLVQQLLLYPMVTSALL